MRYIFAVLTVMLICVYTYAMDDPTADTDISSGPTITEQGKEVGDVDSESAIDIEGSIADSNEVYGTSAEFADDYGYGTAQRELNVQDYGVGDLGEDSLE